jgi:hypothetical protein
MLDVLAHRVYRHLFLAQVIAMVGTGLTTVALALLAHDLAAGQAGVVLGTALAIKMVAYVGIALLVGAYAARLPRRWLLVSLDLLRAAVVWRAHDPLVLEHHHAPMPPTHLHYHDEHHQHAHEGWEGPEPHSHPHHHREGRHRHIFVIDEPHSTWPR